MPAKTLNITGAFGWEFLEEGEVWGLNNCLPETGIEDFNVTAWFQMHTRTNWEGGRNGLKHVEWLKEKQSFPIYMQEKHEDIPSSKKYPKSKVEELWPFVTLPRFSDSFCYMIGLAILQGYEHIHLSGVYLTSYIEGWTEAPGVAIWATIAAERGINITEAPQRLLIPFSYGYDERLPEPYVPGEVAAQIVIDENNSLRWGRKGHSYLRENWFKNKYTGWDEILYPSEKAK